MICLVVGCCIIMMIIMIIIIITDKLSRKSFAALLYTFLLIKVIIKAVH